MNLPNLTSYREAFLAKGVGLPLPVVEPHAEGLLNKIPEPAAEKTGWPWNTEVNPGIYDEKINWPKLTIVSPSYNQVGFLEQTIRSVLLQNYPNLEYIIIDGGSNDGSLQIIEKYAPWISYYQSEKDRGQSHAINMGFSLSSGSYHAWINSDDYYLEGVFHLVITNFIKTGVDFIYGYGIDHNILTGEYKLNRILPFIDYFIKIPGLVQPSTFWSSGIHEPIWEELHCALDYELWLRLVKGHRRLLLKQPLSVAHIHDEAKTHSPKMKARWEADHQLIWGPEAHGTVHEWKKIVFLNRIRVKLYRLFKLI
ncbi:glycosyltransferase involved in cell wall biosynthesis [Mucilaginibacter oryzae]|uniref:Glycosyltransferase involved in cell wall biosynthesis n=1 Tax=Mucilaginibacter oryzae TaxID=468058 RepID=A0A316HIN5_9SPHI|nr:glycosyltransferase family 2 protein [Mucilaginibacter oryzae]PWK79870.1 glycosyltransferase involved in cell wall biosynthesis [Mucilaginibacter oryzae]